MGHLYFSVISVSVIDFGYTIMGDYSKPHFSTMRGKALAGFKEAMAEYVEDEAAFRRKQKAEEKRVFASEKRDFFDGISKLVAPGDVEPIEVHAAMLGAKTYDAYLELETKGHRIAFFRSHARGILAARSTQFPAVDTDMPWLSSIRSFRASNPMRSHSRKLSVLRQSFCTYAHNLDEVNLKRCHEEMLTLTMDWMEMIGEVDNKMLTCHTEGQPDTHKTGAYLAMCEDYKICHEFRVEAMDFVASAKRTAFPN